MSEGFCDKVKYVHFRSSLQRGGATVCYRPVVKDGKFMGAVMGVALCSPQDVFSYRDGQNKASRKAQRIILGREQGTLYRLLTEQEIRTEAELLVRAKVEAVLTRENTRLRQRHEKELQAARRRECCFSHLQMTEHPEARRKARRRAAGQEPASSV